MKRYVTVVDYKVANIFNIAKALEHVGAEVRVTTDAGDVMRAERLVLPGVGAYEAGVEGLKRYRLIEPIQGLAEKRVPILGICLGAQLLLSEGHEFGVFQGLNLIPGEVVRFPDTLSSVKVPHIGWNALEESVPWSSSILKGIEPNTMMYFNHSYFLRPTSQSDVTATTTYGGLTYAAALQKGTVHATQFHPEKSGEHGLTILKNFLSL